MTRIISITGDLGSGKSTVSRPLCEQLGYEYIYTGKIQREIAHKYNMTTLELNKYAETHPEIDEEIDSTFKALNESTDLIVDSRLAWFFLPNSFKIFLKTNLSISADRISSDNLRKNETYSSTEEAVSKIIARKASENKRYMELYGADCSDLSNFNLIVDTSYITPEEVMDIIIDEYYSWLESGECCKAFIAPENLYPTRSVHDIGYEALKNIQENSDSEDYNESGELPYDSELPIEVVNVNSFDYILDGHKRVACALTNNINLIPVVYPNKNHLASKGLAYKDDIIKSISPNYFREWENINRFTYHIHPQL